VNYCEFISEDPSELYLTAAILTAAKRLSRSQAQPLTGSVAQMLSHSKAQPLGALGKASNIPKSVDLLTRELKSSCTSLNTNLNQAAQLEIETSNHAFLCISWTNSLMLTANRFAELYRQTC